MRSDIRKYAGSKKKYRKLEKEQREEEKAKKTRQQEIKDNMMCVANPFSKKEES